jgi:hypothetical protein
MRRNTSSSLTVAGSRFGLSVGITRG